MSSGIIDPAAQELHDWWLDHSTNEIDGMIEKLMEYGTGDLYEIGRTMLGFFDPVRMEDHALCYEIGVMFYVVGKINRVISAAHKSEQASDDTWHDLAVYSKMVLARRAGVMP
jgi:hypothetical protein